MSLPIFLATLGQRPEAITMALDILLPRYHYLEIGVLHTDPISSGIAEAFAQLVPVLHDDYPDCDIITHELRTSDNLPLQDITDQLSAEGYFYSLAEVIRQYRQRFVPIHLLVSGGRKAMSIYATVVATYLFGEHDRVWTILTQARWMQEGLFHLPPPQQQAAKIVQLPLLPTNIPAGAMTDLESILHRRSPRQRFLEALTKQEAALAQAYTQHPYASNEALGELLTKSERTVENQFRSMYSKMLDYFDIHVEDNRKRQVLLDILIGRI